MPTAFTKRLADIAQKQFDKFHLQHEHDPALAGAIIKWHQDLGFGPKFNPVKTPWSALFVSWCVQSAGASAGEFKFSLAHSVFVHQAIQNGLAGVGVFRAFDINAAGPKIGDLIQHNRNGNKFDFAFARANKNYESHSAIVIETGHDSLGNFAVTIGGNEGDTVGMKVVRLDAKGLVKQRPMSPFICVVQDLK